MCCTALIKAVSDRCHCIMMFGCLGGGWAVRAAAVVAAAVAGDGRISRTTLFVIMIAMLMTAVRLQLTVASCRSHCAPPSTGEFHLKSAVLGHVKILTEESENNGPPVEESDLDRSVWI